MSAPAPPTPAQMAEQLRDIATEFRGCGDPECYSSSCVANRERAALLRHAADALERLETVEAWIRREWWLSHGCEDFASLYSDDGEMQCHRCRLDFKRHNLDDLSAAVAEARLAAAARKLTAGRSGGGAP